MDTTDARLACDTQPAISRMSARRLLILLSLLLATTSATASTRIAITCNHLPDTGHCVRDH